MAINCPACKYCPTVVQAIQITNPFRYSCPACNADLTLGAGGTVYLAVAIAFGIGGGVLAATRFNSGAWTAWQTATFLIFVLVVVLPTFEWLVSRLATAKLRKVSSTV